jgi:tRNA (mo5U34)-methyltransferase
MPFESLEAALDPDNPTQTIEGLPAPRRAILLARA